MTHYQKSATGWDKSEVRLQIARIFNEQNLQRS